MDVTVLDVAVVEEVLGHGDLRAVEDGWLVHVVPRVEMLSAADVVGGEKPTGPVVAHLRVEVVQPRRRARPAVALEVAAVLVLAEEAQALGLRVDRVAHVHLEVRVDDGDHLASSRRQVMLQAFGVGEQVLVPGEVALPDGVLDVKPEHVIGDVMLVEFGIDHPHVGIVLVVPAALMVAQREGRRHELRSYKAGVLHLYALGSVRGQEEHVDDATLAEPVRTLHAETILHIHHGLSGVEPEEGRREVGAMRQEDRHRAVERLVRAIGCDLVLEHVEIVQTVGLVPCCPFSARVSEHEAGSAFRKTIHVLGTHEIEVNADGLWSVRLAVLVRPERFLPQTIIFTSNVLHCTLRRLLPAHFPFQ
mmetsp:Transcript_33421/g.74958  ORF Transcript_33421/g.74958 Transcript_33421/m.74958 type:complete len:362 (+) Transcript_33421:1247-2332(+)